MKKLVKKMGPMKFDVNILKNKLVNILKKRKK